MFGWTGEEAQRMSDEEYCARGLACFYDAARAQLEEPCMVLDYEDLVPSRLMAVASYAGITLPPVDSAGLQQVLSTYAKDPAGTAPFEDDRARKQDQASDRVKEAARRWAEGAYEALKHRMRDRRPASRGYEHATVH